MTSIRKIDYAYLPKQVKRQLRDSLNNPDCIVYQEPLVAWRVYAKSLAWAALLAFFVWLYVSNGFGDPLSEDGVQAKGIFILYCILGTLIAYVLGAIFNYRHLCARFPFKPGLYLLPFTLIDARSTMLKVYDLVLVTQINITIHKTNGRYTKTEFKLTFKDGKKHSFFVQKEDLANELPVRWDQLKAQTQTAHAKNDLAALRAFDPFAELRNNNWQLKAADPAQRLWWARVLDSRLGMAVIFGCLCGGLLGLGRNYASDRLMYQAINEHKTEANYLGYISHGWLKVREARAALPRVAFEEVRRQNSVTALKQLLQRYPAANLQEDVRAEIHQLYQKAFAQFQKQAPESAAGLIPVMQRLLDVLEASGNPDLQIHFTRPSTAALEDLDQRLKQRGGKFGNVIPAASHFTATSAASRESRITAALQLGFKASFPNDVLSLRVNNQPTVLPPMLDIKYDIEPSGALYTEQGDGPKEAARQFVGLVARFNVALQVPDTVEQWQFNLEVQPPDTFTVNYKTQPGESKQGPQVSQVYAVMAERAFDQLSSKLRGALFRAANDPTTKLTKL